MRIPKIIVHTDIFLDHLLHREQREASILRLTMQRFFCYTTVFNAIELFSLARTSREQNAIERTLSAVKILGLNARSAKRYGAWIASGLALRRMNSLIAGICLESSLPVLTTKPEEFRGVRGLVVVPASKITADGATAGQILRSANSSRRRTT